MRSRKNRFYTKEQAMGDFPVSVETKTRKPRLISLIAFLILVSIGGFFLFTKFTGGNSQKQVVAVPTKSVTPTMTETPTPQASASGTVTPSISPTGKASAFVDKATGLDRSTLTVAIQNGSGVAGAAGKIAATLKTLGYSVGAPGNAQTFDYTNITVQVKSSKATYLALLKKDLSSDYTVGQATKDLPETSTTDALIIVGK